MEGDGVSEWPLACFFKLILEPRFDLQILEIPNEFMKTHGNDLSNFIYLKIPTGEVWELNLVRENGKTFLQNGWEEFVQFYSLSHGHFLTFKYRGNSRFDVIIFDMSACEIEYPIHSEACREIPPIMKKIIGLTKVTKPSSLEKVKAMRINVDAKLIIARYSSLTPEESKRVRAYAYQRKQPLFVIRIQPSFVVKDFYLGIPKEFANRYLDKKRPFNLTFNLQIDAGKTWPVLIDGDNTHVKFKKGWKDFALENKLKVGDICIFELINKHKFQVRIFRVSDEENAENLAAVFKTEAEIDYPFVPHARERPLKKRKTNEHTNLSSSVKEMQTSMDDKLIIAHNKTYKLTHEEYKRVRDYYARQCNHPVFVTKMQPSFVGNKFIVGVPKEFRKRYLDKKQHFSHKFNLRTDSGKTWPVTIVANNTHAKLKMGWKSFALDNKLNVDDTCIFELINQQEFKVSILRVTNAKRNHENLAVKSEF